MGQQQLVVDPCGDSELSMPPSFLQGLEHLLKHGLKIRDPGTGFALQGRPEMLHFNVKL